MKEPKCINCHQPMNYYSSIMTFACLKCHTHIKGIFAWNKEEALEKFNTLNESER